MQTSGSTNPDNNGLSIALLQSRPVSGGCASQFTGAVETCIKMLAADRSFQSEVSYDSISIQRVDIAGIDPTGKPFNGFITLSPPLYTVPVVPGVSFSTYYRIIDSQFSPGYNVGGPVGVTAVFYRGNDGMTKVMLNYSTGLPAEDSRWVSIWPMRSAQVAVRVSYSSNATNAWNMAYYGVYTGEAYAWVMNAYKTNPDSGVLYTFEEANVRPARVHVVSYSPLVGFSNPSQNDLNFLRNKLMQNNVQILPRFLGENVYEMLRQLESDTPVENYLLPEMRYKAALETAQELLLTPMIFKDQMPLISGLTQKVFPNGVFPDTELNIIATVTYTLPLMSIIGLVRIRITDEGYISYTADPLVCKDKNGTILPTIPAGYSLRLASNQELEQQPALPTIVELTAGENNIYLGQGIRVSSCVDVSIAYVESLLYMRGSDPNVLSALANNDSIFVKVGTTGMLQPQTLTLILNTTTVIDGATPLQYTWTLIPLYDQNGSFVWTLDTTVIKVNGEVVESSTLADEDVVVLSGFKVVLESAVCPTPPLPIPTVTLEEGNNTINLTEAFMVPGDATLDTYAKLTLSGFVMDKSGVRSTWDLDPEMLFSEQLNNDGKFYFTLDMTNGEEIFKATLVGLVLNGILEGTKRITFKLENCDATNTVTIVKTIITYTEG